MAFPTNDCILRLQLPAHKIVVPHAVPNHFLDGVIVVLDRTIMTKPTLLHLGLEPLLADALPVGNECFVVFVNRCALDEIEAHLADREVFSISR